MASVIHSYCQVLGTGDDGSSPCLLVSIERAPRYSGGGGANQNTILRRYLFNVGEGTQRFCGEAGVKLGKVDKLFVTGTGAEEHAGLTELILTLSALGSPTLEVFGPAGIDGLVEGIETCSPRHGRCPDISTMPLPLGESESQCSYVLGDEHMEVRCGVLDPARLRSSDEEETESSESSSSECGSEDSSDESGDSSSSSSRRGGEGDVVSVADSEEDLASVADSEGGTKSSKRNGTDTARVEGGVVSTEVIARDELDGGGGKTSVPKPKCPTQTLAANQDPPWPVGVPSRGPAVLYRCRVLHGVGSTFLVLSCPNLLYIPAVKNHAIVSGARGDNSVLFVIHLSPEDVVEHAAYAPLLKLEGTHLVLGCGRRGRLRGAGGIQHRKVAERSVQLNFVAPQAFPLHYALRDLRAESDVPEKGLVEQHISGRSMTVGRSLLKAVLLPVSARGMDTSAVPPPINIDEIRQDIEQRVEKEGLRRERDSIVTELEKAHQTLAGAAAINQEATQQPEAYTHDAVPGSSGTSEHPRAHQQLGYGPYIFPPPPPPPPIPFGIYCSAQWSRNAIPHPRPNQWPMDGACFLPPPPSPQVSGAPPHKRSRTVAEGDVRPPLGAAISYPPPPPSAHPSNYARPTTSLFTGGGLEGAEVFFLGTGSAAPTKNRGCSGILLRIPQRGLVRGGMAESEPLRLLIDAGAGTLGHLERQFGRQGAREEIRGLDCVWISHKHADHYTGLFRIIVEHKRAQEASSSAGVRRSSESASPLLVVAPSSILTLLEACKKFSGEEVPFQGVSCRDTERDKFWCGGSSGLSNCNGGGGNVGRQGTSMLLEGIRSVPVIHCKEAYGLVLQLWKGGSKLVYSGDTRPCDRLVRAGAGADLLIHEATFDDSKQQDAVLKKHCTTSEALHVGSRMGAKTIVLTHFSQRYPRVPVLDTERAQHFCVAFDGMVLNNATVGVLPSAARILSQVLESKTEEEDDDAQEIILE